MTDEMNGDTTRELASNNESQCKSNSDLSYPAEDFEFNSASRLDFNKGVKCRVQKVAENDERQSPKSPSVCSDDYVSPGGGRLKFFKDGKFILELSHRKDGEKTCWIPVPKKTYWPLVSTPRHESSTTLSVSDDSSSIQSSPWQRDHCWKQVNPRANLSRELEFCYVRSRSHPQYNSQVVRTKGRRPFDLDVPLGSKAGKFKAKDMKKESLSSIIKLLWERTVNSCKLEQGIVSPRKRILRELERVTLEEASKRQRAKTSARSVSSHSISSILAKDDESVLRNLLRSPSPDNIRSAIPNSTYPSHQIQVVYPPSTTSFFPQVTQSFRSQLHPSPPSLWPLHYPPSSPSPQLPLYPIQAYSPVWPHSQRLASQDTTADVPLNLSKNAG